MMKLRMATLLACLVLTGASGRSTPSLAPTAAGPIPAEYLGLHVHNLVVPFSRPPWQGRLTPWPEVPFGSWRLWDARAQWLNLEPQRGRWDFTTLDRYVALAAQRQIEIVLPLGLTPAWASSRPDEKAAYGFGMAAPARDMEDWRNYVRTVAERYKGRIRVFELWNEVNYKQFYSGTQDELVELARVAYQAVKAVDPANTFVAPAVVGAGGHLDWLDAYLARGGKDYADVVAYHFYVPKGRPEDMLPLIARVRQIMARHGLADRPLWNTETGWAIGNSAQTPSFGAVGADWRRLDGDLAGAYVVRAYLLGAAAGLGRFHWYAWDNPDMGLIDPGDQSLKPAARGFAAAGRLLVGSTLQDCREDAGTWACRLTGADGRALLVLWRTADDTARFAVPPEWAVATAVRVLDGVAVATAGTLEIGPQPVVLSRRP